MKTLLLKYTPPQFRADLDLNDGFDPHDHDHIAEDPTRSLRFTMATEAMKHEVPTTDDWISITLLCGLGGQLDETTVYLDLIESTRLRAKTARELKVYAADIIKVCDKELRKIKTANRAHRKYSRCASI